jgi:hypothetical protein
MDAGQADGCGLLVSGRLSSPEAAYLCFMIKIHESQNNNACHQFGTKIFHLIWHHLIHCHLGPLLSWVLMNCSYSNSHCQFKISSMNIFYFSVAFFLKVIWHSTRHPFSVTQRHLTHDLTVNCLQCEVASDQMEYLCPELMTCIIVLKFMYFDHET